MNKTIVSITLVFSVAFISLTSFIVKPTNPPCDSDEFVDKCAPELGEYVFIKTFPVTVNKSGEKTEYSYVFSKGSEYKIVICDKNEVGKKMIVNFYDRGKKLIGTNYLKSSKKFYPSIVYNCSATGVYYVEAYFEGDKSGCGINLLGFKK